MRDIEEVLASMKPWFENRGSTVSTRARTPEQRGWDSAVLTCSEFVRRVTGDEVFAYALHRLLTPNPDLVPQKTRKAGAKGK